MPEFGALIVLLRHFLHDHFTYGAWESLKTQRIFRFSLFEAGVGPRVDHACVECSVSRA